MFKLILFNFSKNIMIIKIYFFIFSVFSIFTSVNSEKLSKSLIKTIEVKKFEDSKITNDDEFDLENDDYENFKFYKIDFTELDNKFKFIKISFQLKNENSFRSLFLYVNKTLKNFLSDDDNNKYYIEYIIHEKRPTVFVPKKFFKTNKYLYFFAQCEKNIKFSYTIETFTSKIILNQLQNKFNILLKPGKIILYHNILNQEILPGYFIIGLLTNGILESENDITLNVICPNNSTIGEFHPYFIGGVGVLITYEELKKCKNDMGDDNMLKFILYNNLEDTVLNIEFITDYILNKNEVANKEIYENDIYHSIILGNENKNNKQCYKFKKNLEDREEFYSFSLNIRSTISELKISYYEENSTKQNNKIISFTGMLDINIDNNNSYYYICIENNKDYNAGIQFQLRQKLENINERLFRYFCNNPILPLINGFPTHLTVSPTQNMFYKIDLTQLRINKKESRNQVVKYHLTKLKSTNINLSHLRCKKFGHLSSRNTCKVITENKSYKMNFNIYLNYYYEPDYSFYYDEYVMVSCEEDSISCEFLLEVNVLDGDVSYPIQLLKQNFYYKPILKSNIDKYKINLSESLSQNTKLYIILYMFNGDADLSFIDDEKKIEEIDYYSILGKKKYFIYEVKKNIILNIKCISSGYYALKYYTIKNEIDFDKMHFSLPVGEINFEEITFNDGIRTYELSSLLNINGYNPIMNEEYSEYYIIIIGLNCILKAEFMDKTYTNTKIQLIIYQKDIKKNNLFLKLEDLDSHSKENNASCIYYITAGTEKSDDNKIIISEGIAHSMPLTKKINSINYIYPYSNDDNILSISIYKFTKNDLDINIRINDIFTPFSYTMKNINYKKFIIYINELKEYCSNYKRKGKESNTEIYDDYINLCPININIKLPLELISKEEIKENEIINHFKIEINSNRKTPSYIRSGEIKFDSLLVKQYSSNNQKIDNYLYYYTDVGDNSPCEIIINSKIGNCEAVAKIVKKDEIESGANWDKRVRLPIFNDNYNENYLEYNYELNKFIITEKDLEKCEKGCEIYIGVFTRETSMYFQINDFSITYNNNYEITSLLFNQNIDDSLTNNIQNKYYISSLENQKINQLVFTFDSYYCSLCINILGNSNNYKNKCDWKLDNIVNGYKNYMLTIKDNDNKLKGKNLTSVYFLTKISSKIYDDNSNKLYSLKINKQLNNLPNIINVDSTNNEIAQIDTETGLTYYFIRVQSYQPINELNLYVLSEETIINDNLVLYAKIIDQDEFNKEGYNENLFKENYKDYNFTSKDNKIKNYLKIDLGKNKYSESKNDKIVFLVVKCEILQNINKLMNHYVKIMTSFYKPSQNTGIKQFNYYFYNLESDSPEFYLPTIKNKYSVISINSIEGKETFKINDENLIDIESSKNYLIILDREENENFANIRITNKENKSFLFYIYYYLKNTRDNLFVLNPNKENIISFHNINNISKHKSLFFYFNLNEIQFNENEKIIIQVNIDDKYLNKNEKLNILSSIISDDFIYENTKSEQYIINSPIYGDCYFDKDNNMIYTLFNGTDIKKYIHYFKYALIAISNDYINYKKNNYLYINIKVLVNVDESNVVKDSKKVINEPIGTEEEINENKGKFIENKNNLKNNIIWAVVIFCFFVLICTIRCLKKRNIKNTENYFNINNKNRPM